MYFILFMLYCILILLLSAAFVFLLVALVLPVALFPHAVVLL